MVALPGVAPFLSSPHQLPYGTNPAASVALYGGTTERTSTAAEFWTELGTKRGVSVDSNFTAATPKDILDWSGDGPYLFGGFIGPTQGAAETLSATITIDGVVYTIPTYTVGAKRAVCGMLGWANVDFTTANNMPQAGMELTSDKKTYAYNGAVNRLLPTSDDMRRNPGVLVFCRSQLKVTLTVSANVTGTASNERQSGVLAMKLNS